ncbi:MAG: hypothetical protein IJB98_01640 [Clostridia bacterium]|nr:hypothetical protein [Clostridia bacterium]
MLNLLFDATFWYILLGIAGAVVITILCMKYVVARIIVGTLALLLLFVSSIFSGIYLNKYYSAEGGIYGHIEKILKNEVDAEINTDSYSFELKNIVLTATSNANEFSAVCYEDKVIVLDKDTKYGLFINGIPLSNINYGEGFVSGIFNYNFYDLNNEILHNGNLQVGIGLCSNTTRIYLTATESSENMKYWYKFFEKNKVVIDVKPFDYKEVSNINVGDNVIVETENLSWGFNYTDAMFDSYYVNNGVFPCLSFGWHEGYIDMCTLASYTNSYAGQQTVGGFVGVQRYEEEISIEIIDNVTMKITNISNNYDYLTTKTFKLNYFRDIGKYTLTDIDTGIVYEQNYFNYKLEVA